MGTRHRERIMGDVDALLGDESLTRLERLKLLNEVHQRIAHDALAAGVEQALNGGETWAAVGDALGMRSRQHAQQQGHRPGQGQGQRRDHAQQQVAAHVRHEVPMCSGERAAEGGQHAGQPTQPGGRPGHRPRRPAADHAAEVRSRQQGTADDDHVAVRPRRSSTAPASSTTTPVPVQARS